MAERAPAARGVTVRIFVSGVISVAPSITEAPKEEKLTSVRNPNAVPRGTPARIPELDGLRGLAILSVLLFHLVSNSIPAGSRGLLGGVASIFRLGWSGVDLFFVLSGFLIGGILLDSKNSPRYFPTFYMRRLHRIIPIYFLWIMLFAVLVFVASRWLPLSLGLASEKPRVILVYLLFLQNLVNFRHSDFALFWLAPLWSLAVEEQVYLLAPAVIRFLSVRHLSAVLTCTIAAAPMLRVLLYLFGHSAAMYTWMPSRADALAMGVLAAVLWRTPAAKSRISIHPRALRAVLFLLFCGVVVLWKWFPAPQSLVMAAAGFTCLAGFYAVLMLTVLLDSEGVLARVARGPILRELGCLSYCIYLIHLAVNGSCHALLRGSLPVIRDWAGFATTAVAAGAIWGIAKISWLYFEKPLIRRGHAYQY